VGGSQHKKTVEIFFHARGRHRCAAEQPASLPNIKRVCSIKILGVSINNQLSMSGHITALLGSCARTLYGVAKKSKPLPSDQKNVLNRIKACQLD